LVTGQAVAAYLYLGSSAPEGDLISVHTASHLTAALFNEVRITISSINAFVNVKCILAQYFFVVKRKITDSFLLYSAVCIFYRLTTQPFLTGV